MATPSMLESAVRGRGPRPGQVVSPLGGLKDHATAHGPPPAETAPPGRERAMESPYFWGVFDPLPEKTEEGE